jgi:hypothetical protein
MSLIQSARMNGHDPYAYLKDVLTQTHRVDEGQLITTFDNYHVSVHAHSRAYPDAAMD